jgi:hypothetical protein
LKFAIFLARRYSHFSGGFLGKYRFVSRGGSGFGPFLVIYITAKKSPAHII